PAGSPPTARVPERRALPRLAAVDIGTNSLRLVFAEIQPDGTYRVLDEDREMTRLGRGLAGTGKLATETMEHSLQTLGRMKAIAEGFGVQDLRAIATSAVREASNGPEFCAQAWRRLRVRVEVVSPEEEARRVFKSVARHYRLDARLTAVVEISGGGGTFTNRAAMAQAERDGRITPVRDYTLSRAELVRLLDRLRESPLAARREMAGLDPTRADIIVAGVAVVARLTRRLGTLRVL